MAKGLIKSKGMGRVGGQRGKGRRGKKNFGLSSGPQGRAFPAFKPRPAPALPAELSSLPKFVKCMKFKGRKAGYCFKKGKTGIGYYIDRVQIGNMNSRGIAKLTTAAPPETGKAKGSAETMNAIKGGGVMIREKGCRVSKGGEVETIKAMASQGVPKVEGKALQQRVDTDAEKATVGGKVEKGVSCNESGQNDVSDAGDDGDSVVEEDDGLKGEDGSKEDDGHVESEESESDCPESEDEKEELEDRMEEDEEDGGNQKDDSERDDSEGGESVGEDSEGGVECDEDEESGEESDKGKERSKVDTSPEKVEDGEGIEDNK
ncbi:unnamed protein product, partial [Choristocarpus tenellus]